MIGLIGIGLLGTAIAERLLAAGHDVLGFDTDPAGRAALEVLGGQAARSAAEVADRAAHIVLSLPNSDVARTVLDEIEPHLGEGAIVIDTTTGDPDAMAGFGERLARRKVCYLDAMVSGSSRQVREGDAILMCGGEERAYTECASLLEAFARRSFHLGPSGSGARMKLVVNLVLGLNRAVLAEGLIFARAAGLDPALALDVLRAGAAWSRVMDTKGEKMLRGDFSPEARLSQHLKDVGLILAAGEHCGVTLPLSILNRELLERAEAAGFGAADNSAIIKAFER